jgi:hypothetical protein
VDPSITLDLLHVAFNLGQLGHLFAELVRGAFCALPFTSC